MRTTDVPKSACPACGEPVECATSVADDITPSEGCTTVCFDCAACLVFRADLTLRLMTPGEWADLPPETRHQVEVFQRVIRERIR